MGDWTREQLRTAKSNEKKLLKNAPTYEILNSNEYREKFQFTPVEMVDTPEEQAVTDVILKVMYLGYIREGYQEFDFKAAINKGKKAAKAKLA